MPTRPLALTWSRTRVCRLQGGGIARYALRALEARAGIAPALSRFAGGRLAARPPCRVRERQDSNPDRAVLETGMLLYTTLPTEGAGLEPAPADLGRTRSPGGRGQPLSASLPKDGGRGSRVRPPDFLETVPARTPSRRRKLRAAGLEPAPDRLRAGRSAPRAPRALRPR